MIAANETLTEALPIQESLVTITFEGLLIFCINQSNECELGLLHRADHDRSMTVVKIAGPNAQPKLVPHGLSLEHNIRVEVEPEASSGVEEFEHPITAFLRKDDQGDSRDLRWIVVIDGPEFHGNGVTIDHPELLRPRFHVKAGQLYTRRKTTSKFARVKFAPAAAPADSPYISSVGVTLGIDIPRPGTTCTKVVFRNINAQGDPIAALPPLELLLEPGSRYEVSVKNDCAPGANILAGTTDFRFYYDVLSDAVSSGEKFDLKLAQPITPGAMPLNNRPDLTLDGDPQACNPIRTSQSNIPGQ